MRSHVGKKLLAAALLAATLAGCGAQVAMPPTTQPAPATMQPAPATAQPGQPTTPATAQPAPATATSQPTPPPASPTLQPAPGQPAARPTFSMQPQGGAPGTTVTLRGWGYAPDAWVGVYLGVPSPVGTALTSVRASAQGAWEARVVIPANLPDGRPVPATNVTLATMNDRFQTLASAPFGFVAPQQPAPPAEQPLPSTQQAREVAQTIIVIYGTAPVERYMARAMRDAYVNGRSYEWLMGFNPLQMTGTPEIGEPLVKVRTALVPVVMAFPTERKYFLFELVVEDGAWKVAGTTLQRTDPIPQVPPVNNAQALPLNQEDSAALGQLMLDHLRPARPGRAILTHAVAGAGDYALGVARPAGEMDVYFYFKRENGAWREVLVGGPTTRDVLVSHGIPVSLEVPQPMLGVAMGVFGYYNGGSGGAADGYVVTDRIGDGYARATIYDAAQGPLTAYVRLDGPVVVLAGQVFAPEVFDQLGIPMIVRA